MSLSHQSSENTGCCKKCITVVFWCLEDVKTKSIPAAIRWIVFNIKHQQHQICHLIMDTTGSKNRSLFSLFVTKSATHAWRYWWTDHIYWLARGGGSLIANNSCFWSDVQRANAMLPTPQTEAEVLLIGHGAAMIQARDVRGGSIDSTSKQFQTTWLKSSVLICIIVELPLLHARLPRSEGWVSALLGSGDVAWSVNRLSPSRETHRLRIMDHCMRDSSRLIHAISWKSPLFSSLEILKCLSNRIMFEIDVS